MKLILDDFILPIRRIYLPELLRVKVDDDD